MTGLAVLQGYQFQHLVSVETNATTTSQAAPFNISYLIALANDGTDTIFFQLNGVPMTLKAGQVVNDLPINCQTLTYLANSGTQAFRAWGMI